MILINKICYYCDTSIALEVGGGLNRINSDKGYTLNNVRPCCAKCNRIMSDFTKEELKERVYKIVQRMD